MTEENAPEPFTNTKIVIVSKRLNQLILELDNKIQVSVIHCPDTSEYAGLRVGSKIHLYNVHLATIESIQYLIACSPSTFLITTCALSIADTTSLQLLPSYLELSQLSVSQVLWLTNKIHFFPIYSSNQLLMDMKLSSYVSTDPPLKEFV